MSVVVYHADWGTDPKKRWLCKAARDGDVYRAQAPTLVGDHSSFLNRVKGEVGTTGTAVVGFDFPIGIPTRYATLLGVSEFKSFLLQLGQDNFSDFYRISTKPSEISTHRPFYPHKPGGAKHNHLVSALGLTCIDDLRRRCELGYEARIAACPLFWTLGANQVGRAAIIGWRDVIVPALLSNRPPVLWPFDGSLEDLLIPGNIVIVETYPAECYRWLFESGIKGKGKLEVRKRVAPALLSWAQSATVVLDPRLKCAIQTGFPDGDDAFDAAVGLFGILEVILNRRKLDEPNEARVRTVEGWIFGQ